MSLFEHIYWSMIFSISSNILWEASQYNESIVFNKNGADR